MGDVNGSEPSEFVVAEEVDKDMENGVTEINGFESAAAAVVVIVAAAKDGGGVVMTRFKFGVDADFPLAPRHLA